MNLYVIRHGETNENIDGIMQGNMETILNKKGRMQAQKLRKKVKKAKIDLVITSPKKRAIETASIVAPAIPYKTDARLLSRDHGEFEGLKRSEINLKTYWNIKLNEKYLSAESIGQIFNRVSNLLNDISREYHDKNVLIITHSGICRVLYYYFNGWPEDGDLTEYESHNCSFEKYTL